MNQIKKETYKFKSIFVNCMSLKNIQALYKIMSQELALNCINNSMNLTPSKRNTKDNLAKSAEQAIVSQKNPMYNLSYFFLQYYLLF